jgi:large subunit ribosomal protein L22
MEIRATLRNAKLGTRKGRLVADLIRRKPCEQALNILRSCEKRPARAIEKLLRSALANAQVQNESKQAGIDIDNLRVSQITVDQGSHSWRIRPRAMGRANWIRKVSSHVTIVLAEQ